MDAPSLLEAGTQIQSEIAIDRRWQLLSLECLYRRETPGVCDKRLKMN
jgi:hypothetical protein